MEEETIFDKAREWIHYWGNGGGCNSLHAWITDKLDEFESENPEATEEELRAFLLDNGPDYGCGEQYDSLVNDIDFED
jgi:hypothetical protein